MLEAQMGNARAYELLLRELASAAISYAGRRLSDAAIAADFSQDVLLAVHRARHTFQETRMFSPWFFSIVKNRFIDLLRATKRRPTLIDSEVAIEQLISRDPEWADMDAIHEAIDRLPTTQQQAIRLRMDGRSTREIATALGLRISATKVTAHRARKALEKMLRQDYGFD